MKRLAIAIGFVALVALLVVVRHGEVGLWDWDTYQRIQFIHGYSADGPYVDGHLLYHGVMRALMAMGFTDVGAVVVETALGMAAFLALLFWICRREQLSPRLTALVLGAATLGSPGLVALFMMVEDNVLYFPVVLGIFYLQSQVGGAVIRRGVVLGALLAIAMLVNISLLVLALALVPAAAITAFRDRRRALGLVVALATALAVYYAAHLFPFTGANIALHEFLPRALGLEDFGPAPVPLLSLDRLEQYGIGLRAIALTPNLHAMAVPAGLHWTLAALLPVLLAAGGAALAGTLAVVRRGELWRGALARIDLVATLGVSLVFPYLYEPMMIERWDVAWIGGLFVLVLLLRRPARWLLGLVGALLVVQAFGTLVTIAHHYGKAWADPALVQSRLAARSFAQHGGEVAVLSSAIDRVVLADFAFRVGSEPRIYLVRDDGACARVVYLGEYPVELDEVRQALRAAKRRYVDPAVPRALLQ